MESQNKIIKKLYDFSSFNSATAVSRGVTWLIFATKKHRYCFNSATAVSRGVTCHDLINSCVLWMFQFGHGGEPWSHFAW